MLTNDLTKEPKYFYFRPRLFFLGFQMTRIRSLSMKAVFVHLLLASLILQFLPFDHMEADKMETLGNGNPEAIITFPSGGGTDNTLNLSLPERCNITSARLEVRGMGVASSNVQTNYTFVNTTGKGFWDGNSTTVTGTPSTLQQNPLSNVDYGLVAFNDNLRKVTTTSVPNCYPYHTFKFTITETVITSIRVGWIGYGLYTGISIAHYQAYVRLWDNQLSSWISVGQASTDIFPGDFTIINTFSNSPSSFVDQNGGLCVLVYGPQNLDASSELHSNHIFVEVSSQVMEYPYGLTLDIGGDGDTEWSHPGVFDTNLTLDDSHGIKDELQELVDAAPSGSWVDIPLVFTSGAAGRLKVSNVSIEYDPYTPLPVNDLPQLVMEIPNGTYTFLEDSDGGLSLIDLSLYFQDPEQDILYFDIVQNHDDLVASLNGSFMDFIAQENWFGTRAFQVSASDGPSGPWIHSNPFEITVTPTNDEPYISKINGQDVTGEGSEPFEISIHEDEWNNISVVVCDIDGDDPQLEIDLEWKDPAYIGIESIDTIDQELSYFSLNILAYQSQVGDHSITFTADDRNDTDEALKGTFELELEVIDMPSSPVLGGVNDLSVKQGGRLENRFTAWDDEDLPEDLRFFLNMTDGKGSDDNPRAAMDAMTGDFSFEPDNSDVGKHHVEVFVEDMDGLRDYGYFTITVENVNDPPMAVITLPSEGSEFKVNENITLDGSASSDLDMVHQWVQEELGYSWVSNISGDLGSGPVLSRTLSEPGKHLITLTVTDLLGAKSVATVNITITGIEEVDDGDAGGADGADDGPDDGGGDDTGGGTESKERSEDESNLLTNIFAVIIIAVALILILLLYMKKKPLPVAELPERKPLEGSNVGVAPAQAPQSPGTLAQVSDMSMSVESRDV